MLGPRGNVLFPEIYGRYIAAGDETALPAVARFIEEAPHGSQVTALIEVADQNEIQELYWNPEADVEIRWILRDSAPVDEGHLSALETALRGLGLEKNDKTLFVFAAGEATALKPIRRYLRRELGLSKDQVDVDGSWKKGTANLDHHSNELADDD